MQLICLCVCVVSVHMNNHRIQYSKYEQSSLTCFMEMCDLNKTTFYYGDSNKLTLKSISAVYKITFGKYMCSKFEYNFHSCYLCTYMVNLDSRYCT